MGTAASLAKFAQKGADAQRAVDALTSKPAAGSEVGELVTQFFGERKPGRFTLVPSNSLAPSRSNPRKAFSKEELAELARSIQSEGILQPLLVRPTAGELATDLHKPTVDRDGLKFEGRYEIVTGERRWRAAQIAGLERVPCIVRVMTDSEALDAQIAENLQRQDITPLEEAAAYRARLKAAGDAGQKMSVDQLAERIGKSRRYVYDKLQLLDLSEPAKKALGAGNISAAYASELVRLKPELQEAALTEIAEGMIESVSDLRHWAKCEKQREEWEKQEAERKQKAAANPGRPSEPSHYQRPAADLARERRARAIAEARNQALRQIVAKVRTWNVRDAAVILAERTRFEGQKVCCRILGIAPTRPTPGFDYRRTLRKHVANADGAALQQAIAALSLVPEDGFSASEYSRGGAKEQLAALYAAGKRVGVDVKRMERELAAAKSKRARTAKVQASAKRGKR